MWNNVSFSYTNLKEKENRENNLRTVQFMTVISLHMYIFHGIISKNCVTLYLKEPYTKLI